MSKLGIVGHFGGNKLFFDGQTVKTKNLYHALEEYYGSDNIKRLDTYGYKKHIFCFFFRALKLVFSSRLSL